KGTVKYSGSRLSFAPFAFAVICSVNVLHCRRPVPFAVNRRRVARCVFRYDSQVSYEGGERT
ncbi:unnamed protein product, partial [Brassica rapa subsp. trilocularis]